MPADEKKVALWDAINRYVVSCGGDPSKHVYGNTSRMRAVVDVEAAIVLYVVSELPTEEATPGERARVDCPSCRGRGHFSTNGKASSDGRDRKCLDCRGTGSLVVENGA